MRVRREVMPMPSRSTELDTSSNPLTQHILRPVLHFIHDTIACHVHLNRGDGDIALRHRMKIRARPGVIAFPGDGNPVALTSARIADRFRRLAFGAMAEARHGNTLELIEW